MPPAFRLEQELVTPGGRTGPYALNAVTKMSWTPSGVQDIEVALYALRRL